jgi:phospholipase C
LLIHGSMLEYWDKNFYTMDEFYQDVANGTLPAYAFVEPRSLYNNNDYHPPAPLAPNVPIGGWSDVRAGDLLAHDIYTAVKASATITGSNALNTLLLVTFDEHGNCFDHVAPPTATTPQNPQPEGELNFFFDRLGVRVPTIVISAYTEAGSSSIDRSIMAPSCAPCARSTTSRPLSTGTTLRRICRTRSRWTSRAVPRPGPRRFRALSRRLRPGSSDAR